MAEKQPRNYAQRKAAATRALEMLQELPWETVGDKITKEWAVADTPERRDALWHEMQAIKRVREKLQAAIADGKQAVREQAEANKPTPAQARADAKAAHMARMGIQ